MGLAIFDAQSLDQCISPQLQGRGGRAAAAAFSTASLALSAFRVLCGRLFDVLRLFPADLILLFL